MLVARVLLSNIFHVKDPIEGALMIALHLQFDKIDRIQTHNTGKMTTHYTVVKIGSKDTPYDCIHFHVKFLMRKWAMG